MGILAGGAGEHIFVDVYSPLFSPFYLPFLLTCLSIPRLQKLFSVSKHGGTGCAGVYPCLPGDWHKWPTCLLLAQPSALPRHQRCWWRLVQPLGTRLTSHKSLRTLPSPHTSPTIPACSAHAQLRKEKHINLSFDPTLKQHLAVKLNSPGTEIHRLL